MSGFKEFESVRPAWLSGASQQSQQQHDQLMQEMIVRETLCDRHLGKAASLKTYASFRAKEWMNSAFGVSVDPEKIKVTCRYEFDVGPRKLVQEDTRTFAELALFGLHDSSSRFDMIFEGPVPSKMNRSSVENWLAETEIRLEFWEERRKAFNNYDVQIALMDRLQSRLAYSVFVATLQGHLNQSSRDIVDLFLQGDRSISASAFVMTGYRFGFRDLMVFQNKANSYGKCVLYAPGSPGGLDWYEFPNIRELEFHVAGWSQTAQGLNYLIAQAHVREKNTLTKYMKTLQQLPSAWKGATFSEWPPAPEGILAEVIFHQVALDMAQENVENPDNWRYLPSIWRQIFARHNTELKALYTVGTRETRILSYDRFCYDLIKQTIETKLQSKFGEKVEVDPDQIFIELSKGQKVTLTQIVIKETELNVIRQDGSFKEYPRFHVGEKHPSLSKLSMENFAFWSKYLRPGEKYIAMMRAEYLNSQHPQYAFRREVHFQMQHTEMRRSVMASYFAGALTMWVRDQLFTMIGNLGKTGSSFPPYGELPSTVQHSAVFKFHVKRCLIEGVYVFRLVDGRQVMELLYTPNAPDGVHFRPLSEFFASIKEYGLGQYYYDRVQYIDQRIMGTFVNNIEFRNISEEFPVLELNSRVLSLRSSYNERIERIISTVDAQTTSRNEILTKSLYDAAILAATVVSLVIPPVGLALAAVTITKNLLEGAEAYRYGDRATAFNNFKDVLLDLALLVPGGKKLTLLQKTLIEFVGDTKTMLGLIEMATGQSISNDRLFELLEKILNEGASGISKTIVH